MGEETADYYENLARQNKLFIPKKDATKDELLKASVGYTAIKIHEQDPYFFMGYYKNQYAIEDLFHEAENAMKVSEIANDDDAICLINKVIKVEYDQIRTPITIKEALNCLKLRDQAYLTQGIKEIHDFGISNYNGIEYAIKYDDNSTNYVKLKNFNLIQNVIKWLNTKRYKTPHFEQSVLESIRIGIGIKICLKGFKLLNGLKTRIPEFINKYDIDCKNDKNDKYDIILFQFSNFLFYYLKNIFEYVIGKKIKSGYDQDFDHSKVDEATKIKWVGYENRDNYPKNLNHSKKRPVCIKEDGIYSITNNYAFKFENISIREKKILLITDASYPFISDFDAFKMHVLFYDFKNPFDYFLNDVMDKLVNGKLVNGKLVMDKSVNGKVNSKLVNSKLGTHDTRE
ncbi:26971_t:CDS:2 [Dentiscutata erythropus]|uniref:26971_t:CDS:1 n=1 Tax=Dentiscutata erythropus TaxID=1348616 RepID=A0A9N9ANE3_9GLOM|nr:26971_t:CDS:2 [Dentiscutata erythropus]